MPSGARGGGRRGEIKKKKRKRRASVTIKGRWEEKSLCLLPKNKRVGRQGLKKRETRSRRRNKRKGARGDREGCVKKAVTTPK